MSMTLKFEELDQETHDYLTAVRDTNGSRSPGVFARTSDSLPGVGCILGPIIIVAILIITLVPGIGIVFDDPVRVAMLQTGGILLGGWLLAARLRTSSGNNKIAGNWVYVDSLHIYEAFREQLTITPIDSIADANVTHNYNNNAYQNSVIRVQLGERYSETLTMKDERRAEQMRIFLSYVAWSRGPEGGARANLDPATLGGLAKYVATHGEEPLDAENNLNLTAIELDRQEIPEDPKRDRRAMPSVVPYIVLLLVGVVCFFTFAYVINPPIRDTAIYQVVTKEPYVEPRMLRAYLIDSRNKLHRAEVMDRLSRFYTDPINHVRRNGGNTELREGFAKVLESVQNAEQPVVSMRVSEANTPEGKEAGKAAREKDVREQLVNRLFGEMVKYTWGQPIKPVGGAIFVEQPPPIAEQLIAFIEPPEGANKFHFDITYTFQKGELGNYDVIVRVEIRTHIDDEPVANTQITLPGLIDGVLLDQQMFRVSQALSDAMVGCGNAPPPVGGPPIWAP